MEGSRQTPDLGALLGQMTTVGRARRVLAPVVVSRTAASPVRERSVTTHDLVWDEQPFPPKAVLGTAYAFATGQRLFSGDFEGGKSGAVKVLEKLGFIVHPRGPGASHG
jgi:hypothetical protein